MSKKWSENIIQEESKCQEEEKISENVLTDGGKAGFLSRKQENTSIFMQKHIPKQNTNEMNIYQKLILMCKEENMKLLGSHRIFNRIYRNLWELNRGHKGVFTRKWNECWKDKLDETHLL